MSLQKEIPAIQVLCYAGYKADEKPMSFLLHDKKLVVEKILDQWRTQEFEYFKVLADDGKAYLLRFDYHNHEWSLEKVFLDTCT